MRDLGVRLQLYIGQKVPAPAPFDVVDALDSLEVSLKDRERDGFQLTFLIGRHGTEREFMLLKSGLLDPPNHVTIMVIIQGRSLVLINGMITRHQVVPSSEPGQSRLYVTGEDSGLELDRKERSKVFRNLTDSQIVARILQSYPDLKPAVTKTDDQRVSTQQATDLSFIQKLANQNSFVFFTEPTKQPGTSTAYWGPPKRTGLPLQPPLTLNMSSDSTAKEITFDYNALERVAPETTFVEEESQREVPVGEPEPASPPLSKQPGKALRTEKQRDAAKLKNPRARLRALQAVNWSADTVMGSGTLDTSAYGWALQSRQLVEVRGVGFSYDGVYYVQQVTHQIKRGAYTQSFTLAREGRGATSLKVRL
jgi:phage protein D